MRKTLVGGFVFVMAALLSGCIVQFPGTDTNSQGERSNPLVIKKTVTERPAEKVEVTVTEVEANGGAVAGGSGGDASQPLGDSREYPIPTSASVPSGLVMSGTITQHSDIPGVDGRSYEMYVLIGQQFGDIVNVYYPSLGCAGYVDNVGGNSYVEHITVGDCDDKGTWKTIESDSSNTRRVMEYSAPTGRYTSTVTLTR